jgi:hypothetical protein
MGVLTILDAGLQTTRQIECDCMIVVGAVMVQRLVLGVAVGVFINCQFNADGGRRNAFSNFTNARNVP